MIGDSLRSDVKGAIRTGMNAVLLDRASSSKYNNKISSLNEVLQYI